jgi:hypothetical protein
VRDDVVIAVAHGVFTAHVTDQLLGAEVAARGGVDPSSELGGVRSGFGP